MYTQDELDNHADQLNPNNDAYWESRGYDERPDDWEDLIYGETEEYEPNDDYYEWAYDDLWNDPYVD